MLSQHAETVETRYVNSSFNMESMSPKDKLTSSSVNSGSPSHNDIKGTCPICLEDLAGKDTLSLDVCDHIFCHPCLKKWSTLGRFCPVDRKIFRKMVDVTSGNVITAKILKRKKSRDLYDVTRHCEECGFDSNGETLLLCDSCDLAFHCKCLNLPMSAIPVSSWYCPGCTALDRRMKKNKNFPKKPRYIMHNKRRPKMPRYFTHGKQHSNSVITKDLSSRVSLRSRHTDHKVYSQRTVVPESLKKIRACLNATSQNIKDFSKEPCSSKTSQFETFASPSSISFKRNPQNQTYIQRAHQTVKSSSGSWLKDNNSANLIPDEGNLSGKDEDSFKVNESFQKFNCTSKSNTDSLFKVNYLGTTEGDALNPKVKSNSGRCLKDKECSNIFPDLDSGNVKDDPSQDIKYEACSTQSLKTPKDEDNDSLFKPNCSETPQGNALITKVKNNAGRWLKDEDFANLFPDPDSVKDEDCYQVLKHEACSTQSLIPPKDEDVSVKEENDSLVSMIRNQISATSDFNPICDESCSILHFEKEQLGKIHNDSLLKPGYDVKFQVRRSDQYTFSNKMYLNTQYEMIKSERNAGNSCKLTIPNKLLAAFSKPALKYLSVREDGSLYMNW